MAEQSVLTKPAIQVEDLDLYYGDHQALYNIALEVEENSVTALIGPSGCGKSTFLRTLNRMNDLIPGVKIDGKIRLYGEDIYDRKVDVEMLRKQVGMVFQTPNPFPKSIYDNIAYGPRIHGIRSKKQLESTETLPHLPPLTDAMEVEHSRRELEDLEQRLNIRDTGQQGKGA